jgi:uncharacterized protein YbaR (Trm112 family)
MGDTALHMIACVKCKTDRLEAEYYPSAIKRHREHGKRIMCKACHRAYYRGRKIEDKHYMYRSVPRREGEAGVDFRTQGGDGVHGVR